jgi:hypothetical protein
MKKLRLLVTQECHRSCPGCCNKDWDLDALPVCMDFTGYDEIILTGGEPRSIKLWGLIRDIQKANPTAKLYVYTAEARNPWDFEDLLCHVDGITLTLHDNKDLFHFGKVQALLESDPEHWARKSLRLHVFEGVDLDREADLWPWKVKWDCKWIENCPLPQDEVFMRLLPSNK